MQTALRKMGNSTGIILPRSILGQIGVSTGAAMELQVENGKLIVTPVKSERRQGWAAASAVIAGETAYDDASWQGFGNEEDADLKW